MRVELTTSITGRDIDLGKVADTSDLDIIRCLDKVNTLQGSVGNSASSTARLGAPRDFDTLGVTNSTRRRLYGKFLGFVRLKIIMILTGAQRQKSSAELWTRINITLENEGGR